MNPSDTGSLSLRLEGTWYTLIFYRNGWLAVDLLRYLDDVLEAEDPPTAILKLLGYTLRIGSGPPRRRATHWVEVDLAQRRLATNSGLVRRAVDRVPADADPPRMLEKIHTVLDRNDFTVVLHPGSRR
ncbi:MAG: hypothetical protein OXH11_14915 [Candidatus Aminicenantes bacterium]|nr:hypothetical protein [Candidatus Aminicenantes bacterium]